ncbi:hypothetical protein CR513_38736, partial [Mucuna pruriens]
MVHGTSVVSLSIKEVQVRDWEANELNPMKNNDRTLKELATPNVVKTPQALKRISCGPAKALRSSTEGPRPMPSRPGPTSNNSLNNSPLRNGPVASLTLAIQHRGHLGTS